MDLNGARKEIDRIDEKMVELFEARLQISESIASYKKAHQMPIVQPEREAEVIKRAISRLKNPRYQEATQIFFETMMTLGKKLQKEKMDS